MDFQSIRLGLNRKIDWPGIPTYDSKSSIIDTESDRWEIHGQSTFLGQGYPAFRAPYSGPNSLTPAGRHRLASRDLTGNHLGSKSSVKVLLSTRLPMGFRT
jgi:hypothetical protein